MSSSSSSSSFESPVPFTLKHSRDVIDESDSSNSKEKKEKLTETKATKEAQLNGPSWDDLIWSRPRPTILSLDVESVGLTGTSFGYAHTFYDVTSCGEVESFIVYGDYKQTPEYVEYQALLKELELESLPEDDPRSRIPWIEKNVIPAIPATATIMPSLREFREAAWTTYQSVMRRVEEYTGEKPDVIAGNGYPVEAKFFIDCTNDDLKARCFKGPFPLHEVCTYVHSFDLSPDQMKQLNRREPNELPVHNPLADARQSLRIWVEAAWIGTRRRQSTNVNGM